MADTQIKITADTSQAERRIRDLEAALEGINKVSGLVGGALAALTAASAGVAVAFKSVADQVGELADLGKALGMSAQQLLFLQQSAQLAGIGADELNAALFRLRGNIGDALVKGTGPAKDALDRLGISARELSTIPADQQIAKITERLREIPNPAERSALSIDLLGKQGPRLLEVAENAKRIAEEAERLGIALSDVDVRNFELAGDAIDELAFIAKGILRTALAELAPYVIALAQGLKDSATEGGNIGNVIRERVIPAIRLTVQAMAVLATYFVAAKLTAGLIAATGALISMYNAIKVATGAAAVMNAVLGKNPLLKIAGAVAGLVTAAVVVDQVGDAFDALDKKAEAISKNTAASLKKEKELRNQLPPEVARLNQEEEKLLKALEDNIKKLEQSVSFERDRVKLGETQANINKMIAEETAKLAKENLSMTDSQRKRITNAYLELQAIKDSETITKSITDLDNERLQLAISDKKEREVAVSITRMEDQLKRSLTETERERLTNSIKLTQQSREQAAIAEVIADATREQTELEKINRGLSLQKTIGGGITGGVTAQREYDRDQEALQTLLDRKIISDQQYFQQREELARQYNLKVLDLELKRIETVLMAEKSGSAAIMSQQDQATVQAIGQQERQRKIVQDRIEFEKKSDLQKTQFGIQQAGELFSALGAQNKKAFEAAKAFNIANAVMNTYMAATKALATYPPPFSFIAASAAVALGLAQVAQIRSQSYSGRQLGGPVMAGQSYIVGENSPEIFTPSTTGRIDRLDQLGSSDVNVTFNIVANDTAGFDDLLLSRRGLIRSVISDAMLESGRRG
jgi:hypothetical protein